MFTVHHGQNGICNKNLCLIQDLMRTSKLAKEKFKCMCKYFPNLSLLTKSATQGEVQLTSAHTYIGNKSLGVYVTEFALVGLIDSPTVGSMNANTSFLKASNNIRILITEILLCNAA